MKIKYTCQNAGSVETPVGAWTWAGDGNEPTNGPNGDPIVDENSGILSDILCNSDDLVLDKDSYGQSGLEIDCVEAGAGQVDVTDPDTPTVPAQNNCLLVCDWYPVLQFYTKGGDGWFYKYMEEYEETALDTPEVIKDVIRCW